MPVFSTLVRSVMAVGLLGLSGLAGCSPFGAGAGAVRGCPPVYVLRDAARRIDFRDGPGRDLTDVRSAVEISGFSGDCAYDDDERTVEVRVQAEFEVEIGPAQDVPQVTFPYFLALRAPDGAPVARSARTVRADLPENTSRIKVRDDRIAVTIPLDREGQASGHSLYLGLQVTRDQLDHNRRQLDR